MKGSKYTVGSKVRTRVAVTSGQTQIPAGTICEIVGVPVKLIKHYRLQVVDSRRYVKIQKSSDFEPAEDGAK